MKSWKPFNITLKLLIDTKANKVLFAEASKDFVDFLFYLLSFPIGGAIKLLANKPVAGSIRNIYTSLFNLNETYLKPTVQKNHLLNPMFPNPFTNIPMLVTTSSTSSTSTNTFYTCTSPYCSRRYFSDKPNLVYCYTCLTWVNQEASYLSCTSSNTSATQSNVIGSEGYVQGGCPYMISDDLSVTPISMISSITLINKFNIPNTNVLQERVVRVGTEEGLELLKTSFYSTTVLTNVFLGKI